MEFIGQMSSGLWTVWMEMWEILKAIVPRAILFCLWILTAIIVLPCVFVSGVIYPKWVDWGENL